jgi:type II secretory pathway pseudopilin PulG
MKSLGYIRKNNKKTGFTMVEVVVAALVFSLAVAGIFATIASLTNPAEESKEEVAAAFLGKQIFEKWREEVDQGTWDTSNNPISDPARVDAGWFDLYTNLIGNTTYTTQYRLDSDSVSGTDAIKVTLNLIW